MSADGPRMTPLRPISSTELSSLFHRVPARSQKAPRRSPVRLDVCVHGQPPVHHRMCSAPPRAPGAPRRWKIWYQAATPLRHLAPRNWGLGAAALADGLCEAGRDRKG